MLESICSFCGKSSKDVGDMIVGATACICNTCTEANMNILATRNSVSQSFVPSFSLSAVCVSFVIGNIIDVDGSKDLVDLNIEWLKDMLEELSAYELREAMLGNELKSLQECVSGETVSIELFRSCLKLTEEKAKIAYEIEMYLKRNLS